MVIARIAKIGGIAKILLGSTSAHRSDFTRFPGPPLPLFLCVSKV